MPFAAGTRLGPYEILAPLGAGGMGEVYRARDTRLDRIVAVKVLPEHLSSNPQFRERFDREARAISSLSHPHICPLYDVGHQDGIDYLVMEYLEGQTLAARFKKGPLALEQVLQYGIQLTDALDTAHRHGVTHRDLKPGNIVLTKTGVKLVDFGLAKIQAAEAVAGTTALPTQTTPLTGEGAILGTLQYMAPEQLEGKEADARTDIFAFGVTLYEMLTWRKAFEGKSQASLISAIMTAEPPPVSTLQRLASPALDRVISRCLAKDPEERWQRARDLTTELRWITEGGTPGTAAGNEAAAKGRTRELLYGAVVVILLLAAIFSAVSYRRLARVPARTIISEITPPDKVRFNFTGSTGGSPVLSPDGRALAFPAVDASGKAMLWVRSLDSLAAHPLPGTEGAGDPFWSPDSRALGFFADGKLKTIDASGGPAIVLAAAPADAGGSWNRDGTILFVPDFTKGLYQVAAAGGNPVLVNAVDASKFSFYAGPRFLPDGKHFLYRAGAGETYFASLDGKERRLVVRGNGGAAYASGFLLYLREGTLMAQAFDPERGQLKGDPHPIAERVSANILGGLFDISENGILIYQTGSRVTEKRLTWYDRTGKNLGITGEVADYFDLRLSPDGQKLASNASYPAGSFNSEVWVHELVRAVRMRLTIDPDTDHSSPVWSPDGSRIVFGALDGKARRGIYQKPSNGGGAEELLRPSDKQDGQIWPTSWSRDGKFILYTRGAISLSQADIWVLPLEGDRKPQLFVQAPAAAYDGQFSPDGRWVAYTSRESGRDEVCVVPFNAARFLNTGPASAGRGGKWQISTVGGSSPRWRRDGKEIFFLSPASQMMAAEVKEKGNSIVVRTAQVLFKSAGLASSFAPYDVTPDGRKFVINTRTEEGTSLTLVVNWTVNLKKQ